MIRGDVSIGSLVSRLRMAGLFDVFGAGVINKLLAFLSGLIVVRLIPQDAYGVYSYAYTALNIILLFNGLGAASAILQFASEYAFAERRGAVEAFGLSIGLVFDVLLAIVLLLTPIFVEFPVAGSGRLLSMWFLLPFFQFICDAQLTSLRSALRNREYALATNINTALILVASTAGAFLGGSIGLIIGRTFAFAVTAAVVFFLFGVPSCFDSDYLTEFFASLRGDCNGGLTRDEKRSFLAVSVTTAVNSGINQLVYYLGVTIIGILTTDATAVALFQTSLAIPTALNFVPQTLALFVYPYFARHKDEPDWVLRRYTQVSAASTVMAFGIAAFFIVFSDKIVTFMYGNSYLAGASVLRILMIGWFFSASFRSLACNLLVTQHRLAYGVIVASLSAVVLAAANCMLVPVLGVEGAAWAQVIVYVATGLAYSCYFVVVMMRKRQTGRSTSSM